MRSVIFGISTSTWGRCTWFWINKRALGRAKVPLTLLELYAALGKVESNLQFRFRSGGGGEVALLTSGSGLNQLPLVRLLLLLLLLFSDLSTSGNPGGPHHLLQRIRVPEPDFLNAAGRKKSGLAPENSLKHPAVGGPGHWKRKEHVV